MRPDIPREPTESMIEAMISADADSNYGYETESSEKYLARLYRAAWDAAHRMNKKSDQEPNSMTPDLTGKTTTLVDKTEYDRVILELERMLQLRRRSGVQAMSSKIRKQEKLINKLTMALHRITRQSVVTEMHETAIAALHTPTRNKA